MTSNVIWLKDRLSDLVTGLGSQRDRTTTQVFAGLVEMNPAELEVMYRSDWLAGKIVDIIPQDMIRAGRQWQATKEQITAIENYEKLSTINLWPKIREALVRSRIMGGAALFIGIRDADPSTELRVEDIGPGDLSYLTVIDRYSITYQEVERDPQSPWYGDPKMWSVSSGQGSTVLIHPSRIIKFLGSPIVTRYTTGLNNEVWGDSVLMRVYEAVKNATSAQQHIAGLIPDARTDVLYIPELGRILENDQETAKLTKRFGYARDIKSMFRMMLLEGNGVDGTGARGETWKQRQVSFSDLPELMRSFLQIAAGAADIPVTRLLGESPAGENSTGEADLRNYYDHVKALQRLVLEPRMNALDRIVKQSAGVKDDAIFYMWAPLWSMSEKEKAEVFGKKAEAARKLVGSGKDKPLVSPLALSDALVNSVTEDGSLPGLELAVTKHGALSSFMKNDDFVPEDEPAPVPGATQPFGDAAPRSLYVRRNLINVSEFVRWASDAGFVNITPSDQLHVTVLFSKTPVDWIAMRSDWSGDDRGRITIPPGGPRVVEKLGPTATVLTFWSDTLAWRHQSMLERGASSEHEGYTAHVTISHAAQSIDISKVTPFQGALRFGPEIFEEVDENWRDKVAK